MLPNLDPRKYRFHVIACNNDGVWNETGATLNFSVLPAWYQTFLFRSGCVVAFLALLWALYQLRLRQLERQFHQRLEARVEERTRIARELHDTLLQGVLSASIQLHVAVDLVAEDSPARPLLRRVKEIMEQVIAEGRNAVQGLRLTARSAPDLDQAFAQIRQEFPTQSQIGFRVFVEGVPRSLRPIIRDEVYLIGREALSNAFHHSHASDIEVELEYAASQLRVCIRDNGDGIDPEVQRRGREGHWGLTGMNERTDRMGAKLRVLSRAAVGTEVELSVPGQIAYEYRSGDRVAGWLSRLYPGKKRTEKLRPGSEQVE